MASIAHYYQDCEHYPILTIPAEVHYDEDVTFPTFAYPIHVTKSNLLEKTYKFVLTCLGVQKGLMTWSVKINDLPLRLNGEQAYFYNSRYISVMPGQSSDFILVENDGTPFATCCSLKLEQTRREYYAVTIRQYPKDLPAWQLPPPAKY